MPFLCSQCSAHFASDETCQERFNAVQLLELEQQAYWSVHHLSVPCYMLQHNHYSREGWLAMRELLHRFVVSGLPPAVARRQIRPQADSGRRTWSFTRGAKLPGVEHIAWTYTIADVRLDTAESYCADVRRWAERVLADSEQLVRASAECGW